jgi:hypothetical protein
LIGTRRSQVVGDAKTERLHRHGLGTVSQEKDYWRRRRFGQPLTRGVQGHWRALDVHHGDERRMAVRVDAPPRVGGIQTVEDLQA